MSYINKYNNKVSYTCAETAKFVRTELKESFPATTFSVVSSTYSMGASIRVKWTNGPTEKQVKAIVSKYEGSTFDGMQDLKSYVDGVDPQTGKPCHFGADSVHCERQYNLEVFKPVAVQMAQKWDIDPDSLQFNEQTKWTSAAISNDQRIDRAHEYLSTLVWRELTQTSFDVGTADKPKVIKGVLQARQEGESWFVFGDTYPKRRDLYNAGGRWNKTAQAYEFKVTALPQSVTDMLSQDSSAGLDVQSPAESLRSLADRMQKEIDYKSREMTQNPTYKRLRELDHRLSEAKVLKQAQGVMRSLADSWDSGTVDPLLSKLRAKNVIMWLLDCAKLPYADYRPELYKSFERIGISSQDQYEQVRSALLALISPVKADGNEQIKKRVLQAALNNIPSYFPTPADLAREVIEIADIQEGDSVLEPSAGTGHLADLARDLGADVLAVECQADLCKILQDKGHKVSACHDFLRLAAVPYYNKIIMNPPFENGQDLDHVRHAYDFLSEGGTLVAIMSPSFLSRQQSKWIQFWYWLRSTDYEFKHNDADAFSKSDRPTYVNTVTVTIRK